MKEPKYPKLEDLPKENKYNFFEEGIFPEEIEEKKRQNKNRSTRKQNRFPLSMPAELKKPANTQKDEELVPFFAKNYPPSSESKEDICFINSPIPSDTPDNTGEAEEVSVEEEESDESENKNNKSKKKENNNETNNNINNDDFGASVEFNSELEYEYEHPSKMMSREEVQEMIRKNQERKREEQRKREEEEKRKKLEEENRKKEEEKRKKEEEKRKKEEEKMRKEKEEKEMEKEKERLKKMEEDKKKKMKSSKKDPINALSSIKKNYDDNSNMASNSMINDMQNIFAIPEEKGENDEDEDDTKKNFKKSSKEKYSERKSKSKKSKKINDFNENIEKNKNKKNPKSNTEDDEETTETDLNKKSKNNKVSRKSNGIKKEEKKEKLKEEEKINEEGKEEEYSNYGDELADSNIPPKKEKVPQKRSKKSKKRATFKKIGMNNEVNEVTLYHALQNIPTREFRYIKQDDNKTFGETRKYSLRQRLPVLRHEYGEKAIYVYDEKGLCTLIGAELAQRKTLKQKYDEAYEKTEKIQQKKKKKLVKGLHQTNETIPEEESEYNSELLDSENISEFGDDDARILKIPKGGKKSLAKNFDVALVIKIIEANGKNVIKVDEKEYKNLKSNNSVKVGKHQQYEILNFSNNTLVVQLVFDDKK